MSKKIMILNGHPDPSSERLCYALAEAYAEGATHAGHTVNLFHIGALEIPFLSSAADFETSDAPKIVKPLISTLRTADHLVIIYPMWHGMLPAKLKACLEQVLRPGVALKYSEDKQIPKKLMKGKTARIIVTIGMPSFFYRHIMRAHSLKALRVNILKFCGFGRVQTTVYGMVEAVSDKQRRKWLATARKWGITDK